MTRPTPTRLEFRMNSPKTKPLLVRAVWTVLLSGLFAAGTEAQVGCAAAGSATLSADSARVGQLLTIEVSGPPGAPFALFGAFESGPTNTPVGTICVSINPNPPSEFRIFVNSLQGPGPVLDGNGRFALSRNVPDIPGLVGQTYFMQAAVSNGGIVLTNSLTLIIGQSGTHRAPLNEMSQMRSLHRSALLADGNALITGGGSGSLIAPDASNTADVYNTATKEITATAGTMTRRRALHTSVLMPNGRVLICGGVNTAGTVHDTAEEFDPSTGTFRAVGSMGSRRAGHTACLLDDGTVLVVGGTSMFVDPDTAFSNALNTAEIYQPGTQTFGPVGGSLSEARLLHTATVLQDGRVLIAGGIKAAGLFGLPTLATTGEVFDPGAGSYSSAGTLTTTRAGHAAIRLPSGAVLLAGGINGFTLPLNNAELFVSGSGFSPTGNLPSAKAALCMALLPDGTVLETGGLAGSLIAPTGVSSASIYRPQNNNFHPTGSLSVARGGHQCVALPDGTIITIGGAANDTTVHATVDRYYP